MRWQDMRRSENVEDRRGQGGPAGGGFGGGMRIGLGGLIVALIASVLFGVNPLDMLGGIEQAQPPAPGYGPQVGPRSPSAPPQKGDTAGEMMRNVLGDTEQVWTALFEAMGSQRPYPAPTLVLFDGRVNAGGCGAASAAVGPFYCPPEGKLYLDTSFFDQLAQRFGAPGDFARAYVLAHEVGHHVQNLTGVMRRYPNPDNATQIRIELQADCYAGVWGHYAQKRNLLEPGDLEEGLKAAAAVGDDMIMKRTRGYVVPDAFTHGSAAQRQRWYRQGLATGDPRQCDTFAVANP